MFVSYQLITCMIDVWCVLEFDFNDWEIDFYVVFFNVTQKTEDNQAFIHLIPF